MAILDGLSRLWWSWMNPMAWQVTIVIAFVWLLDRLLARWGNHNVRYVLWLLVLAKLLLPPSIASPVGIAQLMNTDAVTSYITGSTVFESGDPVDTAIPTNSRVVVRQSDLERERLLSTSSDGSPAAYGSVITSGLSLHTALMLAWMAGVFFFGGWILAQSRLLRRIRTHGNSDVPTWLQQASERAARHIGIKNAPEILLLPGIGSPGVFGLFQPVIFLPEGQISTMSPGDAENIFLHELAHIRRGDLAVQLATLVLQLVYWFHPAVWLAASKTHRLREFCCDASVMASESTSAPQYRRTLLVIAGITPGEPEPVALGLLGLTGDTALLVDRLRHITRITPKLRRRRTLVSISTVLLVASCVLPMAPMAPMAPKAPMRSIEMETSMGESSPIANPEDDIADKRLFSMKARADSASRVALAWEIAEAKVRGTEEYWNNFVHYLSVRDRYISMMPNQADVAAVGDLLNTKGFMGTREIESAARRHAQDLWWAYNARREQLADNDSWEPPLPRLAPEELKEAIAKALTVEPLDPHVAQAISNNEDIMLSLRFFISPEGDVETVRIESGAEEMNEASRERIRAVCRRRGFPILSVPTNIVTVQRITVTNLYVPCAPDPHLTASFLTTDEALRVAKAQADSASQISGALREQLADLDTALTAEGIPNDEFLVRRNPFRLDLLAARDRAQALWVLYNEARARLYEQHGMIDPDITETEFKARVYTLLASWQFEEPPAFLSGNKRRILLLLRVSEGPDGRWDSVEIESGELGDDVEQAIRCLAKRFARRPVGYDGFDYVWGAEIDFDWEAVSR
jgi:beta-lactamase regulating signal transducer with metallopeptidase domain